ncbi:hypothetical protein FHL15_000071 [Xylaria flabelliformis]|uniref:Uncharacterized protein n=1 Tax=Xylaria flabelliformis TaxID=2512241 RepID=A0A553IEU9_9PEZI|nr:hypothetical protein FHL15_000071 [Xylaria flabelliformis]
MPEFTSAASGTIQSCRGHAAVPPNLGYVTPLDEVLLKNDVFEDSGLNTELNIIVKMVHFSIPISVIPESVSSGTNFTVARLVSSTLLAVPQDCRLQTADRTLSKNWNVGPETIESGVQQHVDMDMGFKALTCWVVTAAVKPGIQFSDRKLVEGPALLTEVMQYLRSIYLPTYLYYVDKKCRDRMDRYDVEG